MRTTLTLDPDVAARVQQIRDERDLPLKEIVNEALREGLSRLEEDRAPRRKPRSHTRPMNVGRPLVDSFDDVDELLRIAEGEAYR